MKKKYRDIVVDNIKYAYKVKGKCWWPDYYSRRYFKIWENKKVIFARYMDVIISITPQMIADKIKELKNITS